MLLDHSRDHFVFLQAHLGGDRNFCYLLGDKVSGQAACVDPGFDAPGVLKLAADHGLTITDILITHGHGDHIGAVAEVSDATGARIHAGAEDQVPDATPVSDGQEIMVGGLMVKALLTPGHSPGHVCYISEGMLCTGDLLFCGKVGGTGTYFPGSSAEAEWTSLQRLLDLPDATCVFPGHDYYGGDGAMPHSTIGHERYQNPFLICADFEAFVDLKKNWAIYKEAHGIR